MKVVHCSTSVNSSSANTRIHKALLKQGINSWILTMYNNTDNVSNVLETTEYGIKFSMMRRFLYYVNIAECFFLDKICKLTKGMPYTWAFIGNDLYKTTMIKSADIIHIHCVNSGYLSLRQIKHIVQLEKPVVITLHDSWFLTGGCHVLAGCDDYKNGCKKCMKIEKCRNITRNRCRIKRNILKSSNVYFTAPSKWTYNNYLKSGLPEKRCLVIGNTLDYDVFKANMDKKNTDGRVNLLFGAINSTETPYKGFKYLIAMLKLLYDTLPDLADKMDLHIFGSNGSDEEILKKYNCKFEGYIENEREMARLYSMSDIYIVPSLEDSFNQTVLESCACETPVVSFRTGGISDIIVHKCTGYLAEYKDTEDLLKGVRWILRNNNNNCIGKSARNYVKQVFSEKKISSQYIGIYNSLYYSRHSRESG